MVVEKGNLWLFPDDKKIIVKEWYILQGIKMTDLGRANHNLKSDEDGDHIVHVIDLNACNLWGKKYHFGNFSEWAGMAVPC